MTQAVTKTHEIVILKPKPSDAKITEMVTAYFDSEAARYDNFDEATEKRRLFLSKVESLVVEVLKSDRDIKTMLSIGCGTGRREKKIESLLGRSLTVTGVDMSTPMCALARKAGIDVIQSNWPEAKIKDDVKFDSACYLHAFGLVPSKRQRVVELNKIAKHLKSGAPLFLDVMNLHDKNEWGPELITTFDREKLGESGHEKGDVFYRRIGAKALSYFHYFEEKELRQLLNESVFDVEKTYFIGYGAHYGEIVDKNSGSIFVVSRRK